MSDRREQLGRALDKLIQRQRWRDFQLVAFHTTRGIYPSLILSEWSHDGGEDAFTLPVDNPDTPRVSMCASLTGTKEKLLRDRRRIGERGVELDLLVFVTAVAVNRTVIDEWKTDFVAEFGHPCEVITRASLIASLERPEGAWICRDFLELAADHSTAERAVVDRLKATAGARRDYWFTLLRARREQLIDLRLVWQTRPETGDDSREDLPNSTSVLAVAQGIRVGTRIGLLAPAGSGKTTAALQIAEQLLSPDRHKVPVFVSLAEWAVLGDDLLGALRGELDCSDDDLAILDQAGSLVVLLNGWNELATASRGRAGHAITQLLRRLPNTTLIIATRSVDDLPIIPQLATAEVAALSDTERRELLLRLAVANVDEVADALQRDGDLDALTRRPFYVGAAAALVRDGGSGGLTRHALLGTMVERAESGEHRMPLMRTLSGQHRSYLRDLASAMTDSGTTGINNVLAVQTVGGTSRRLVAEAIIGQPPSAEDALNVLSGHHLLVRAGPSVRFVHPLFQAWFAAEALCDRIPTSTSAERATADDAVLRQVNSGHWNDAIELAVERLSSEDAPASKSSMRMLLEAVAMVDLTFAAWCVRCGRAPAWAEFGEELSSQLRTIYDGPSDEERMIALAGMVASGSTEFKVELTTLIKDRHTAVGWGLLNGRWPVTLASFGEDWPQELKGWPEDQRSQLLHDLVFDVSLADRAAIATLAAIDTSPRVKLRVSDALSFFGEERLVSNILSSADSEVWAQVGAGAVFRRLPTELAKSLAPKATLALSGATSAGEKRELIEALVAQGATDATDYVEELKSALESLARDERQGALAARLFNDLRRRDAEWAERWAERRLRDVTPLPRELNDLFGVLGSAAASRFIREAVAEGTSDTPNLRMLRHVQVGAHRSPRFETCQALVDVYLRVSRTIADQQLTGGLDSPLQNVLNTLEAALRDLPFDLRVRAVLSMSAVPAAAGELHRLFRIIGPGSPFGSADRGSLPAKLRTEWRDAILRWKSISDQDNWRRTSRAMLAAMLGEVGEPTDADTILKWIDEDRAEIANEPRQGRTSWTNWYVGALVRLGQPSGSEALLKLLNSPDYIGEASAGLARVAMGEQAPRTGSLRQRLAPPPTRIPDGSGPQLKAFAKAITTAATPYVNRPAGSTEKPFNHDLAAVASSLALLGDETALPLIFRIGEKRGAEWGVCAALSSLVAAGVQLPSAETRAFIEPILTRVASEPFSSGADPLAFGIDCLALLLHTDDVAAGVDRLIAFWPKLKNTHHVREIVNVVASVDHPAAERFLTDLLTSVPPNEWWREDLLRAVANSQSARVAEALLAALEKEIADSTAGASIRALIEALQSSSKSNPVTKSLVLSRAPQAQTPLQRETFASVLAESTDLQSALVGCDLIRDGEPSSIPHGVRRLIENHVTAHESVGTGGAYRVIGRSANVLRSHLFSMATNDPKRARSARSLLLMIEGSRVRTGRPSDEAAHPSPSWPVPPLARRNWIIATRESTEAR